MHKNDIRQKFLLRRHQMDDEDYSAKNNILSERLINEINWRQVRTMHCFLPLTNDHEPDLRSVIEYAMKHGVSVFTSDPSTKTGRSVKRLKDAHYQAQLLQYFYPTERVLDVIIVPMLAYDPSTKHRLGFGGGFYDKLLAKQPQALKIGVCFADFSTQLPVEAHDQPLDTIITA